jgi:hypothetical protein
MSADRRPKRDSGDDGEMLVKSNPGSSRLVPGMLVIGSKMLSATVARLTEVGS